MNNEPTNSDAQLVQVGFNHPGADRKASGPPNRTYDITPHAGGVTFDDSTWAAILGVIKATLLYGTIG